MLIESIQVDDRFSRRSIARLVPVPGEVLLYGSAATIVPTCSEWNVTCMDGSGRTKLECYCRSWSAISHSTTAYTIQSD